MKKIALVKNFLMAQNVNGMVQLLEQKNAWLLALFCFFILFKSMLFCFQTFMLTTVQVSKLSHTHTHTHTHTPKDMGSNMHSPVPSACPVT